MAVTDDDGGKDHGLTERLHQILDGIDYDGLNGWWETSTGMKFGAGKLAEVEALLAEVVAAGNRLAERLDLRSYHDSAADAALDAWRALVDEVPPDERT